LLSPSAATSYGSVVADHGRLSLCSTEMGLPLERHNRNVTVGDGAVTYKSTIVFLSDYEVLIWGFLSRYRR
jgi:hypothetical protein